MTDNYHNFPKEKWLQDIYLYAYHYTYAYIKALFPLKHYPGGQDHDQQSHAGSGGSESTGVTGFWKGRLENNDVKNIENFVKANGFEGEVKIIPDRAGNIGGALLGGYDPKTGRMYLTPKALGLSSEELCGVLVHEIMHGKIASEDNILETTVKSAKSVWGEFQFRHDGYAVGREISLSEYATRHWNNSSSELAFEETMCEMARLDYLGRLPEPFDFSNPDISISLKTWKAYKIIMEKTGG